MSTLRLLKPEAAVEESLGRFIDTAGHYPMQRITNTASNMRLAAFGLSPSGDNMFNKAPIAEFVVSLAAVAKVARLAAGQLMPEAIARHVLACGTCGPELSSIAQDNATSIEREQLCEAGQDAYDYMTRALEDASIDPYSIALQH